MRIKTWSEQTFSSLAYEAHYRALKQKWISFYITLTGPFQWTYSEHFTNVPNSFQIPVELQHKVDKKVTIIEH